MPSPRQRSDPFENCAIGTRQVIYRSDEEVKEVLAPAQEVVEMPILMEMSTHGYIG